VKTCIQYGMFSAPDVDPVAYSQFRRAADVISRRNEAVVATQAKAYSEAQRFMVDLGAEKREKFVQYFDNLVMKMAQKPGSAAKAQAIMQAAQAQDYVTLGPVMKKVYQAFAMKKTRKTSSPPKTEKPAATPRPKSSSVPQTAEELARSMGISYPELE